MEVPTRPHMMVLLTSLKASLYATWSNAPSLMPWSRSVSSASAAGRRPLFGLPSPRSPWQRRQFRAKVVAPRSAASSSCSSSADSERKGSQMAYAPTAIRVRKRTTTMALICLPVFIRFLYVLLSPSRLEADDPVRVVRPAVGDGAGIHGDAAVAVDDEVHGIHRTGSGPVDSDAGVGIG